MNSGGRQYLALNNSGDVTAVDQSNQTPSSGLRDRLCWSPKGDSPTDSADAETCSTLREPDTTAKASLWERKRRSFPGPRVRRTDDPAAWHDWHSPGELDV